mmetsp:Transcript_50973/g.118427  ORF Transcript_50973/g.118427 Transcript_50973/m.118427 type:complete len:119 (+) Transcript_50973:38-394(+)
MLVPLGQRCQRIMASITNPGVSTGWRRAVEPDGGVTALCGGGCDATGGVSVGDCCTFFGGGAGAGPILVCGRELVELVRASCTGDTWTLELMGRGLEVESGLPQTSVASALRLMASAV